VKLSGATEISRVLSFDLFWSRVVITDLLERDLWCGDRSLSLGAERESLYDDAWMRGDGWIDSGSLRCSSRGSTRSGDVKGRE
jgi:hypothetical protein